MTSDSASFWCAMSAKQGATTSKKGGAVGLPEINSKLKKNNRKPTEAAKYDKKTVVLPDIALISCTVQTDDSNQQGKEVTPSSVQPEVATVTALIEEAHKAADIAHDSPVQIHQTTGSVILIYEQYSELFPIIDGICTAADIDEVYCLSFVMPNCVIHLSSLSPQEKRQKEDIDASLNLFVREEPDGTFHDLENTHTYYVYVEQEAGQLKRDQEKMRQIATQMDEAASKAPALITMDILKEGHIDTCTCIYGVCMMSLIPSKLFPLPLFCVSLLTLLSIFVMLGIYAF